MKQQIILDTTEIKAPWKSFKDTHSACEEVSKLQKSWA
jgi:hypothetical protein